MLPRDHGPTSDPPLLALRAEGGGPRGVGHLARCLALAQAWTGAGGRCALVAASVPAPWDERFRAAGVEHLAPAAGSASDAAWWVVDGYDLEASGAPGGARLARIDDHGTSPAVPVEVVVDQNLGATAAPYADLGAEVLAGTRYALLRRELVDLATAARSSTRGPGAEGLRLIVAMGGAPQPAVAAQVDAVIAALGTDHGGAAGSGGPQLQVEVLRGGGDPGPALARADLALAASGSTCWELALFGIPAVLFSVAPNQEPLGRALAERGAATYVGRLAELGPEAIAEAVRELASSAVQQARQRAELAHLVDGRGARRVATRLRSSLVDLRPAGLDDSHRVWALNAEPGVRAASLDPRPIPWEDHERWYAARLVDAGSHLYLASWAGRALGLVRFQVDARVAEIGVVVEPERRGHGWGGALIAAGVRQLAADLASAPSAGVDALVRVDARVLASNPASSSAFLDADFDPQPAEADGVLRYARPMSTGRSGDAHG